MENSKNYSQSNYATTNEDVDFTKLIDMGRKLINENNLNLGEHYLNLALLSPNIDYQNKIQTLAIKSFANFKIKEEIIVMNVVKKILKFLSKNKVDFLDQSILFCILRILYRGGCILRESKQLLTSAYCLYYSKKLFEYKNLKLEIESYDTLQATIDSISKDIVADISEIKEKYILLSMKSKNSEELLERLRKIKRIFVLDNSIQNTTCDSNSIQSSTTSSKIDDKITPESDKTNEKYFLISTIWTRNLITFIDTLEKNIISEKLIKNIDKMFNKTSILNLFFSENGDSELSHYGIYPACVNNFFLMQFKDSWIDPNPEEKHTNIYLKKGIKENVDFFYVSENEWKIISDLFGYNYAIERQVATISNSQLIEVNLRNMKILVLNEKLRESHIHLIKPRNIQISKASKIKDLKTKIFRSLESYIKLIQEGQTKIKIYLFNFGLKEKKNETFQLIFAFKNNLKTYKLKAEEISNDEILIENFNYGPGDIIIAEIDTNFVQIIGEQKQCAQCSKLIENEVKCGNCLAYLYCSIECKTKDETHIKYHENVNKLYIKKFNLQELLYETKFEDLLERDSRHGLVGLKNLGNTCFMNSALQCISHCQDLTKYFLTRKVFDEINRNNSHGTGGDVAKAYYELLQELWQGNSSYLCPTDFRQIFVRFVKNFAGFSQHDSNEMLTFMMDTLHEDLNRVRQKPYVEMIEKTETENDIEASYRWWKNHLTRENSIIVDLFHGQYKSVITCPECSKISITYDPFMFLGLPIPSGNFKINFKFFPYFNEEKQKCYIYEYELPIHEHSTIKDMKYKIVNSISNINYSYLEAVSLTKEKVFKKILKDDEYIFNYFDSGCEIVVYEKYPKNCGEEIEDFYTFYLIPTEYVEERSMIFMKKGVQKILSYPILISLNKKTSVKDLYNNTFVFFRKILDDSYLRENLSNRDLLQQEFELNFNKGDKDPFKFQILNNIPDPTGFFSSKSNCEFCGNKCEFCPLLKSFQLNEPINNLIESQSTPRPFILYVELKKYTKNSKIYENLEFPISLNSKNLISKQESINVYDCLNLFQSEERLEKENAWYCSKCKTHQEAFKRMEIYRAPYYLIIQFKRFKIRSQSAVMGMIANKKNDVLIHYPVSGLDLREYIKGDQKDESIYDLFAISQHFGGLSSGHYTALCKNFEKWYEFDDERVCKASTADVVNNSAYMLFYKKRSLMK